MRPEAETSEVGTPEAEAKWRWPPFAVVDGSEWGRNKKCQAKKSKNDNTIAKRAFESIEEFSN